MINPSNCRDWQEEIAHTLTLHNFDHFDFFNVNYNVKWTTNWLNFAFFVLNFTIKNTFNCQYWVYWGCLLTFDLERPKLSNSNLWTISSRQVLQLDVLIDKIGRPSCWPLILSRTKCHRSWSSDVVNRYVKITVYKETYFLTIFKLNLLDVTLNV